MKHHALVLLFSLGMFASVKAQVFTVTIDAGVLENSNGTVTEPVGGLLQLIASPSGTFSTPDSSTFASGDNVLVSSFAMNYSNGTGETVNTLTSIPFTTTNYTLTAGEQLELRFYPSLSYTSSTSYYTSAPTLGTTFGQVRSSTTEFGATDSNETGWFVPAAGSTIDFAYVTTTGGGTYADTTAYATGTVIAGTAVPEPSSCIIALIATATLGIASIRRKQVF